MKEKEKYKLLLSGLLLLLLAINYPLLDKELTEWLVDYEVGYVERIVDGDTVIVNGTSVRLLGINTPEKGEIFYGEAKEFLESKIGLKMIRMKAGKEDTDRYGRKLRYVFYDGKNVNVEIVREGYGNFYFPSGKDKYYSEFVNSWESCLDAGKNICEKSKACAECITLKRLDVKSQEVVISNRCEKPCDLKGWTLKDEGRKIFVFPEFVLKTDVKILVGEGENQGESLYWSGEEYVWTQTGDSLFLRDDEGKLVLWWSY